MMGPGANFTMREVASCANSYGNCHYYIYQDTFSTYDTQFLQVRLQFTAETFIQYGDFYLVWRVLSGMETFACCADFYLVWRLLSSVETYFPNQTPKNSAYCNYNLKFYELHL